MCCLWQSVRSRLVNGLMQCVIVCVFSVTCITRLLNSLENIGWISLDYLATQALIRRTRPPALVIVLLRYQRPALLVRLRGGRSANFTRCPRKNTGSSVSTTPAQQPQRRRICAAPFDVQIPTTSCYQRPQLVQPNPCSGIGPRTYKGNFLFLRVSFWKIWPFRLTPSPYFDLM